MQLEAIWMSNLNEKMPNGMNNVCRSMHIHLIFESLRTPAAKAMEEDHSSKWHGNVGPEGSQQPREDLINRPGRTNQEESLPVATTRSATVTYKRYGITINELWSWE
jgi:hypothetical protein